MRSSRASGPVCFARYRDPLPSWEPELDEDLEPT